MGALDEETVMNEISPHHRRPAGLFRRRAGAAQARAALFINGEWVASSGGGTIPVVDPSSGAEIAQFVDATEADVDRAVAAARTAFDDGRWTGLSPYQRERIINRLADLIEQHIPELAELESIDNGKPKSASQGYDMPKCVQTLRYMAGWATKISGEHIEPSGYPTGTMHAYVRREPIGVGRRRSCRGISR
jgi:phenylacetaldehyde dehydrogenase